MSHGKSKLIPYLISVVDILLLVSAALIANYIRFDKFYPPINPFYYYLWLGWLLLWLLIGMKFNLFRTPRIIYLDKVLYVNFRAILIFVAISTTIVYFSTNYKFSRLYFIGFDISFVVFILVWRLIFWQLFKIYRKNGQNFRKIVLVGFNENMHHIIEKVYLNPDFGYQITGLITDSKLKNDLKPYYKGKLDNIIPFLKGQQNIYEIVISLPYYKSDLINELLNYADNHLIRVKIIPEFSEYLSHVFSIDYIENIPIMRYRNEPLHGFFNKSIKRFCDVTFSFIGILLILSWLYPLVGLIIKFTSKGPILFKQKRTGMDGLSFNCLKFRSMTVNGDSDKLQACKKDVRITKFGAFLRKTSLDELPQLFNVFFNKMSLVGPRPHMISHTEAYKKEINNFMVRHFAKPGLTGWAQIKGFRGETKTLKDMENRVDADIWYIENWNFMLDIKIILLTIWIVLFKKEDNAF